MMKCWLPFLYIVLLTGRISGQIPSPERIAFILKNSSNRHQSFYVKTGESIRFFTLHPFEKKPQNWPVGSRLYRVHGKTSPASLLFVLHARQAGTTVLTQSPADTTASEPSLSNPIVSLNLLNRSATPKRIVLISYPPNDPKNGTYIFTLAPGSGSQRHFRVGTRLFLATPQQEQQLMRGERIDDQPPFWIVSARDHQQSIPLPNE